MYPPIFLGGEYGVVTYPGVVDIILNPGDVVIVPTPNPRGDDGVTGNPLLNPRGDDGVTDNPLLNPRGDDGVTGNPLLNPRGGVVIGPTPAPNPRGGVVIRSTFAPNPRGDDGVTGKPEEEAEKPEEEVGKPEEEVGKPEEEVGKPEEEVGKPEEEAVKPELNPGDEAGNADVGTIFLFNSSNLALKIFSICTLDSDSKDDVSSSKELPISINSL